MKISIGMRPRKGPWGGGNSFARNLAGHLSSAGHEVCFDLAPPDLDIVLLVDPRRGSQSATYDDRHVFAYLKHNSRTVVVHRVNECDERKGTRGVNRRLRVANHCADHTVFVSEWLRRLHLASGWPRRETSVILNGANNSQFNPEGYQPWDHTGPIKLVTHHWGGNWMKGFDIYVRLDRMLGCAKWRERIAFTYIGNLPEGFAFYNALHVAPLSGPALAGAIKEHHLYVTAARNEPGSNHQNEGALCGLPLLYINDASMPEYCSGFGIPFNTANFESRLSEVIETYDQWVLRMRGYPHTADRMCCAYDELFQCLLYGRDQTVAGRPRRRRLRWCLARATGWLRR